MPGPPNQIINFAGTRLAVVPEEQVHKHLTLADAVADLRAALVLLAKGAAANYPRLRVSSRERGAAWLHTLRAGISGWGVIGGKDYVSLGFQLPAMWVTVIDIKTGKPIALLEADYLSRARTAAASAVATDLLAPKDVGCLCHFGVGKISELLIRALLLVRPTLSKVNVVRGDAGKGEPQWFSSIREQTGVIIDLVPPRQAVLEAEIITTATNSREPVLSGKIAMPRLHHLNLVGANHLKRREIDRELARACLPPRGFLVVDDPQQAEAEAGDFRALVEEDVFSWSDVPSLPDLLAGTDPVPAGGEGLTVFKSLGLGLMDLAVATGVLERMGLYTRPV